MPLDFLILGFLGGVGMILTIIGLMERKLWILSLVGGVMFFVMAASLTTDRLVTVAYQSTGTAINYTLPGELIVLPGVLGLIVMVWSALKGVGWL